MRWIESNVIAPRYRFWTRANVGEVLSEPTSPLGWDAVWEGATVAGWRDLFIRRLGMQEHELDERRAEMIGVFGGYAYMGAGFFRVWAGRTPGMTPTDFDNIYFDNHPDVPPYEFEDWHTNPHTTEVMNAYIAWATGDMDNSDLEADRVESLELRARRPDFASMSDAALVGSLLALRPLFRRMFFQHINQSIAASFGPGMIAGVCASIGHPEWGFRLLTGYGTVDSAAPSYAMWDLSRIVRSSAVLTSAFDAGVSGLLDRLGSSSDADAQRFVAGFADFIAEFGSRGSNEWDLAAEVWEVRPETVLASIDRMRMAPDTDDPRAETASREADRLAVADRVRAALADDAVAIATFDVGLANASTFIPGRERAKTSIIRVIHEGRMAMRELGGRFVERGWIDRRSDIFLLFVDELESAAAGNPPNRDELRARREHHERLRRLEPPYIIVGEMPPVDTWPEKGRRPVEPMRPGDVIHGVVGCPGVAEGRARVILRADDPRGLEPGEILVAPATDPSWTPLFVPAAAVVVDVGALLSHSIIVSRELGIPCVPSALDASRRIPDGARIRVDGEAGTVTLLELP
jgi:pyruvate,water dikinase